MKLFDNFFTLEGGEGVGKTTVITEVEKLLVSKGCEVMITREPGGNKIAEEIRNIIFYENIDPKTEVLLFAAARIEHLQNVIVPALKNKKIVISDRYVDSSIVYQGMVKGLNFVQEVNQFAIDKAIPYKTFILDLDPVIALNRIEQNERIVKRFEQENLSFHQEIRQKYLQLAQTNCRFRVIDANQEPLVIAEQIVAEILQQC